MQPFSQQAVTLQKELTAAELRHAAKMARLSGLCYRPTDQLSEALRQEGLRLISCGQTHFTRWVSCRDWHSSFDAPRDCQLGHLGRPEVRCFTLLGRWYVADGPASDGTMDDNGPLAHEASTSGTKEQASNAKGAPATVSGVSRNAATMQRIVMMRGVVSACSATLSITSVAMCWGVTPCASASVAS